MLAGRGGRTAGQFQGWVMVKAVTDHFDGARSIEHRPVASLIPYARNARTHSDAQVALIAGSIREFGFNNPVLVDGANGIIAGHGRVLAARKLGLGSVPVIELGHLSDAQKRAYILADNRLAEQAGWDRELLGLELADLGELGIDAGDLGFDGAALDALLSSGAAKDGEEATPEPPADPVSRAGDLWHLGPHRLLCGDATDADDVSRLLGGVRPHLMVTDPPYGVNYDPAWRNEAGAAKTKRTGRVANDDRADWREAWALFPGAVAYVWHGALHAGTVRAAWSPQASRSAARSFGPRSGWCSAAGTTTGSTSPAGTPSGAVGTGPATAPSRRSGRSPAATRMPRRCTAPRSRWSACAGRSSTTRAPARRSTSRSAAAAR